MLNYLGISDREMRTRIGTNPRAVWAFMLQAAVFPGLGLLPPTEGTLKAMIDTCVSVDPPAQVSLGLLELICGVTAEHLRQEISHMRKEQTPEEQMGVWESIICR